jgi:Tol biopolymer transport system component
MSSMNRILACLLTSLVVGSCGAERRPGLTQYETALTTSVEPGYFDYAPDGRLAYNRPVELQAGVWVAESDGSNPTRLTFGVWDQEPIWSPDGQWIAFWRDSSAGDVYAVPAEGGEPVPLAVTEAYEYPRAWLPDGSGVVYQRETEGRRTTWTASLTDAHAGRPAVEPRGRR